MAKKTWMFILNTNILHMVDDCFWYCRFKTEKQRDQGIIMFISIISMIYIIVIIVLLWLFLGWCWSWWCRPRLGWQTSCDCQEHWLFGLAVSFCDASRVACIHYEDLWEGSCQHWSCAWARCFGCWRWQHLIWICSWVSPECWLQWIPIYIAVSSFEKIRIIVKIIANNWNKSEHNGTGAGFVSLDISDIVSRWSAKIIVILKI